MPKPTTQLARSRPEISDSLMEFDLQANEAKMIAQKLFPVFETAEQAGDFGRIPIESLLEESDTSRASGASYGRGDYEFEEAFFATKEQGWEEPVDDRDERLYSNYFDAELIAAGRARSKVLVNYEKRAAEKVLSSTNVAAAITPWSDSQGATPIADVEKGILAIFARTGLWPNAMAISYLLYRQLRNCQEVLDRISANGAGDRIKATDVNIDMIAQVFDLDYILVAGGSRNAAKKGQTAKIEQIWDPTKAALLKVAESNDIREPCFGRTFHWAKDGSRIGTLQESYRDETCRSEIQRSRHEVDERVIYPELIQVISGASA